MHGLNFLVYRWLYVWRIEIDKDDIDRLMEWAKIKHFMSITGVACLVLDATLRADSKVPTSGRNLLEQFKQ